MKSGFDRVPLRRVLTGLIALVISILSFLLFINLERFHFLSFLLPLASSSAAALLWWDTIGPREGECREARECCLRRSFLGGILGCFLGGMFAGILAPEGNQWTVLIGVFFAGPLGFTLGTLSILLFPQSSKT